MKISNYSFLFILSIFALFFLSSCHRKPKLEDVRALITNIEINNDTLKSLTATVGEDSMLFTLEEAQYNNGMPISNDSATIFYVEGEKNTYKAYLVSVLPKKGHVVHLDSMKNNKLITVPSEKKQVNKK